MKVRLSKLQTTHSVRFILHLLRVAIFILFIPFLSNSQKRIGNNLNQQAKVIYKPAVFTDAERIQKIQTYFPAVDSMLTSYAIKNHFPAFVYGIIADGKLVHTGSYGYANIDKQIEATSQTDFRIASMTKSLTAMAILKLRDEGKIRLDDPAYVYIPELRNQHYPTKDAAPITVRNLLTHGAGFPEDNPWGDRQLANTNEQLLNLVKSGISFSNDPGMTFEYSNLGFTLLGYIIKKVSGKSYEEYITENILKPLGMNHTYWEYSKIPENKFAYGYRWLNEKWVEQPVLHDGAFGAMGGLITTIEDFSKYVALHLDALPPRDEKEKEPIKRSSIREMQFPWNFTGLNADFHLPSGRSCPVTSAYAYGLGWNKYCDGKVTIGHSGGLPGYGSQWLILPEYGIGIVSFSNLTYANAGGFNFRALDTIVRSAELKPRALPPSEVLTERKNELVQLLPDWSNENVNKIFAMNFFMDYSLDSLKKQSKEIFEKAGKIISVGEVIPENQLRGYFNIEGEKGRIRISFTLTPEREPKVQAFGERFIGR